MLKKLFCKTFALITILICLAVTCQSQDLLRNYDLSTVKVDNLTDAQILKFKQQLDASGLSENQAEQIASAKGMPVSEIQKLRARLEKT